MLVHVHDIFLPYDYAAARRPPSHIALEPAEEGGGGDGAGTCGDRASRGGLVISSEADWALEVLARELEREGEREREYAKHLSVPIQHSIYLFSYIT